MLTSGYVYTLFFAIFLIIDTTFQAGQSFLNPIRRRFDSDNQFEVFTKSWPDRVRKKMYNHLKNEVVDWSSLRYVYNECHDVKRQSVQLVEDSDFIINASDYCNEHPKLSVIIAVHSSASNQHKRNTIRTTWGSLRVVDGEGVGVVFFLGRTFNSSLNAMVQKESQQFRDIVQRDFLEHYHNITRKHITVMEWLSVTRCSHLQYLVKVDDDTFVDVFHLVRLLRTDQTILPHAFYCSATANAKPTRPNGKKSKWVITYKEFSKRVFPPYCEGFGYIADVTLAPSIYWCSVFVPPLWVDDVYVTGILAEKLRTPRNTFKPGHSYGRVGPVMKNEAILDNIFLTSFYNEFLPETFHRLWHTVLDKSMNLP